jgi:hypothetical protein
VAAVSSFIIFESYFPWLPAFRSSESYVFRKRRMPATKKQNAARPKCTHIPDQNIKGALRLKSRKPAAEARTAPSRMHKAEWIKIRSPATINAKAPNCGVQREMNAATRSGATSSARPRIISTRFITSNENKKSDGGRDSASLPIEGGILSRVIEQSCQTFAPSHG